MLYSQPSGYYQSTQGEFDENLKWELHQIIRNHVRFPYSSSGTDTWDILKQSDKDTTNPANVVLLYSGWTLDGEDEYNNGNGWNREHVWPNSHGFPSSGDTAYTDVHHLRPCDISVNGARGNKDFDNGGTQYIDGDGATNCYTDGDSWEPRPEVKGDVARMVMYMAARYEGFSGYDLELVDYTGTPTQPILGKESTLLEWNRLDPPDDFERNRNDVIFSYQQNRNPFVDHPEFADRIYRSDDFILDYATQEGNIINLYFNEDTNPFSAVANQNYSLDRGVGSPYYVEVGYQDNYKLVRLFFDNLTVNTKYILTVNDVTSSSNEQIADNSIVAVTTDDVVPVELISFRAEIAENGVNLIWQTACETNNRGFEIERKLDNNWVKAGFVEGNGTCMEINNYSWSDVKHPGAVQYRLKQVDFDGKSTFSDVVEVINIPAEFRLSQNYPNPFNPTTTIQFDLNESGITSLKIYDVLGNHIATLADEILEAGAYKIDFNASELSSGIYFYELLQGNYRIMKKMILIK
ncbi:MAG: hypothetical protein SCALA702_35690 [Melioribacteraceae bacterium]|nr:MAG: hypothetical protein SCALA702_35690 [Melioribacteraceae bacterium]